MLMKTSLFCLLSLVSLSSLAVAQADISETPVALPSSAHPEAAVVSLGLQPNELLRTFSFSVQNTEEQSLKVFGAQTTSGLYVVDYPKEIGANAQGTVTLLYVARANVSAPADLLRLMTNRGEKVVQINHAREPAITYDANALEWSQGEAAAAKSVTFTMLSAVATPKGVRALGTGNSAVLVALGDNRYRVEVTPASTEKPGQFSVIIQFSPLLPDVPAAIFCTITPRQ